MNDTPQDLTHFQDALELNRIIHEPARLVILAVLSKIEWADFNFLLRATALSKGNLSKQTSKLEEVSYIEIEKAFKGKVPVTRYRITQQGKKDLADYWQHITILQNKLQS